MLLDVTPPPLGNVYIYGELMFEDTRDHNITANLVSTENAKFEQGCKISVGHTSQFRAVKRYLGVSVPCGVGIFI